MKEFAIFVIMLASINSCMALDRIASTICSDSEKCDGDYSIADTLPDCAARSVNAKGASHSRW